MKENTEPQRPTRLDERVTPGWASLTANVLRGGGIAVGLLVLWLGVLTGGFFLLLTAVLAAIAIVGGWLLGSFVLSEKWRARPTARLLSFVLVVAFPVLLVVIAQVAGPLLTPAPQTTACLTGSLARGEQRSEPLAVDPRITSMQFRLQVTSVAGGSLRYFVEDPSGGSAWSGRQEVAGLNESAEIASIGGRWTINIFGEADRAEYQLEWIGQAPGVDPTPAQCIEPRI